MTVERSLVVRRYLSAMERCDAQGVVDCFTDDGIVTSPTYGTLPVQSFMERKIADTILVKLEILAVYSEVDHPEKMAAQFTYHWERRNAPTVDTNMIDFFEFDPAGDRIARLRIVPDPKPAAG